MFLTGDFGIIDQSLRGGEEVQEALVLPHEIPDRFFVELFPRKKSFV
jgi:hypothetical protein